MRFKEDDKKDEAPPAPPHIIIEGWMRLSLKTPGIQARFPPIKD